MTTRTTLGLAALLFLGGCAPKFLISDYFIPDTNKSVRASIQYAGSIGTDDNAAELVNYYLQVCDLNDGKATNCKSTMILDNVLAVDFWSTGF